MWYFSITKRKNGVKSFLRLNQFPKGFLEIFMTFSYKTLVFLPFIL